MHITRLQLAFLHDLIMAAVSVALALYLRVGSDIFIKHMQVLTLGVPLFTLMAGISFRLVGMYKGIWRYASIPDLIAIVKGVSLAIVSFVVIFFVLTRLDVYPRSLPIIQWFLLIAMLGAPRILYRLWRDHRLTLAKLNVESNPIRVLLVGADDGAEIFIRASQAIRATDYRVDGILDEKGKRGGRSLLGVPIYNYSKETFSSLLKELERTGHKPQKLIFTSPDAREDSDLVRELDALADKEGLSLARLPNLTEFKEAVQSGEVSLRSFAIEDLLGRPQAHVDTETIEQFIRGKRVLVTGAGGTIGSELTHQICGFNPSSLLILDHSEYNLYAIDMRLNEQFPHINREALLCNVRDRDRVHRVFEEYKPEIVFHAAALKHVPIVELNPEEGILTNLIGTMNVADATLAVQAEAMVQISTDKAVNPTNVMGASKRLGELYAQALDLQGEKKNETRFLTVRFGNVLGSSGSVVPLFQHQLTQGGPLTVTHAEIKRYFMTVREAVGLVLQASAKGTLNKTDRGQIFVLDMGEPIRIYDVAKKIIRLANLIPNKDIEIKITGLRPGEKLYEELFDASETPLKTDIGGVQAAKPQPVEVALLRTSFISIEKAALAGHGEEIHRLLAQIVKGYDRQYFGTSQESSKSR